MPHRREEAWRSTSVDCLEGLLADTPDGGAPTYQLAREPLNLGQSITLGVATFVLTPHGSDTPLVVAPFNRIVAMGWNDIHETMRVAINGHTPQPVFLDVHAGRPGSAPVVGHLEIIAREGCDAILVLRHTGSRQLNKIVKILAERRAIPRMLSLQEWEADVKHVATHQLGLAGGSIIQHVVVTLGGDTMRICSDAALPEPHADINAFGLYFTNARIHHEQQLFIDHIATDSRSRVAYRGALQDQGTHAMWVEDVGIEPMVYATDSYEPNRNLVLDKGPHVGSVPNLEIHNSQIEGTGHVSATGCFDDEQLFYLVGRGIAPAEAERLVIKAFYTKLLNQMDVPEFTAHVLELVDSRLGEESL